jgi:hypothetical protein
VSERGEHAPQKVVEDHLAGGGGPDLPGADGIARVDDHDGQAASCVLLGDTLGEELRALVETDHVAEADGCGLGAEAPVSGQADGADARGVDHALDARLGARLEHGARALHVVAVDLAGILGPEPIVRRDVEHLRTALDRAGHRTGLEDVAAHHLDRTAFERPEATRWTGENPHAIALGDEQSRDVGPHEAGGARDQHIHAEATPHLSVRP